MGRGSFFTKLDPVNAGRQDPLEAAKKILLRKSRSIRDIACQKMRWKMSVMQPLWVWPTIFQFR